MTYEYARFSTGVPSLVDAPNKNLKNDVFDNSVLDVRLVGGYLKKVVRVMGSSSVLDLRLVGGYLEDT